MNIGSSNIDDIEQIMLDKRCCKCKKWKKMEDFHKDKSRKDGRVYRCKECIKPLASKYYQKNSEKIKQRTKKFHQENKEWIRQQGKKYREKYKKKRKKYEQEHKKERNIEKNTNRRIVKR